MKKFIGCSAVLIMILTFTACGSESETSACEEAAAYFVATHEEMENYKDEEYGTWIRHLNEYMLSHDVPTVLTKYVALLIGFSDAVLDHDVHSMQEYGMQINDEELDVIEACPDLAQYVGTSQPTPEIRDETSL